MVPFVKTRYLVLASTGSQFWIQTLFLTYIWCCSFKGALPPYLSPSFPFLCFCVSFRALISMSIQHARPELSLRQPQIWCDSTYKSTVMWKLKVWCILIQNQCHCFIQWDVPLNKISLASHKKVIFLHPPLPKDSNV